MNLPDLSELSDYRCPELLKKFSRDYGTSSQESELLFEEMKKMLWLMIKHKLETNRERVPMTLAVFRPMDPLDKMWHEFILFTHEYHDFCQKFFGGYVHHLPCSEEEMLAFQDRRTTLKEDFIHREHVRIRMYLEYVERHLGRKTLETWFKGLPKLSV